jgi:hypothetical protein
MVRFDSRLRKGAERIVRGAVQRIVIRSFVVAAAVILGCLGGGSSANAAQGGAGATASSLARQVVPFGTTVVAPDAHRYNFGQVVVTPLAVAPHGACPQLP